MMCGRDLPPDAVADHCPPCVEQEERRRAAPLRYFMVHFTNGLFDIVRGHRIRKDLGIRIWVYRNWGVEDCVANYRRDAVVGYKEVSPEHAESMIRFWKKLQTVRAQGVSLGLP